MNWFNKTDVNEINHIKTLPVQIAIANEKFCKRIVLPKSTARSFTMKSTYHCHSICHAFSTLPLHLHSYQVVFTCMFILKLLVISNGDWQLCNGFIKKFWCTLIAWHKTTGCYFYNSQYYFHSTQWASFICPHMRVEWQILSSKDKVVNFLIIKLRSSINMHAYVCRLILQL